MQSTGNAGKKKKKGKPQQILDLGFKTTGDPNRFNAGKLLIIKFFCLILNLR